MAIMWNAPERPPSLEASAAEMAWRQWLLQTLATAHAEPPDAAAVMEPEVEGVPDYAISRESTDVR